MSPPDAARLEAIRKRLEAATPGPWRHDVTRDEAHAIARVHDIGSPTLVATTYRYVESEHDSDSDARNADLITHAPADLTYLLAEHDRLTARVQEQEAKLYEIAEVAQNYLSSQAHVGVTEQQMRALHARLGSLIGPYQRAYTTRAALGPAPGAGK